MTAYGDCVVTRDGEVVQADTVIVISDELHDAMGNGPYITFGRVHPATYIVVGQHHYQPGRRVAVITHQWPLEEDEQ